MTSISETTAFDSAQLACEGPVKLLAQAATKTKSSQRLTFLDGLRGWGALAVFLGHFLVNLGYIPDDFRRLLPFDAAFAVYVFFAISGFALSYPLLKSNKPVNLFATCAKRYVRLMVPIFVSCLMIYVLEANHAYFHREAASVLNNGWFATLPYEHSPDLMKFIRRGLYFPESVGVNPILWTMKWELLGSLLVFALAFFFRDQRRWWLFYAILALVLARTQLFGFVSGMILARLVLQDSLRSSSWWLALLISVSVLRGDLFRDSETFANLLATAVLASVAFHPGTRAFFESRLSRALGSISFPLYLVHIPILCSLTSYLIVSGFSVPIIVGATFAAVLICSTVFVLCVERPAIKLSHLIGKLPFWQLGLLGSVIGISRAIPSEPSPT